MVHPVLRGADASLFSLKNSFQFHLAKFENFRTEKFSDYKVCCPETIFLDVGPATFFQSNLRHILDYKSISVLINSNIASIHPFFTALYPYKLLFYDVPIQ